MKRMTAEEIRDAMLPKSLRGFDETATRELLTDVAMIVDKLTFERDALRRELEAAPSPPSGNAVDPADIGNALLAAQRAGETLVSEAKETASRIDAEARGEADGILEQARREAAEIEQGLSDHRAEVESEKRRLSEELNTLQATVEAERRVALARVRVETEEQAAEAQGRITALEAEEKALRELIDDRRYRFVKMLESTLAEIDRLKDIVPGEGDGTAGLAGLLASRASVVRDTQLASVGDPEINPAPAEPPDA